MKSAELDKQILQLYCNNCDNVDCKISKGYVYIDGLKGCNRWVSEDTLNKYLYYMTEEMPFWTLYNSEYVNNSYNKIIAFLENDIYTAPIASLRNNNGYAVGG